MHQDRHRSLGPRSKGSSSYNRHPRYRCRSRMTGIVSASAMVVVRDAVCTMVGTSRRVGVDAEGDAGVEGEVAVIAEAIIGGCRTLGGLGGEDVGRRLARLGGGTRRRTGGDAFLTL